MGLGRKTFPTARSRTDDSQPEKGFARHESGNAGHSVSDQLPKRCDVSGASQPGYPRIEPGHAGTESWQSGFGSSFSSVRSSDELAGSAGELWRIEGFSCKTGSFFESDSSGCGECRIEPDFGFSGKTRSILWDDSSRISIDLWTNRSFACQQPAKDGSRQRPARSRHGTSFAGHSRFLRQCSG